MYDEIIWKRIFFGLLLFPWCGIAIGNTIEWKSSRAIFKLNFELIPAVEQWTQRESNKIGVNVYEGNGYVLHLHEESLGNRERIFKYSIKRADNQSFKVDRVRMDCLTSYAGVYKFYTPGNFAQQNYKIDLSYNLADASSALSNQPVIWLHETNGDNTMTFGFLDQVPTTHLEGSTYNAGNGGEAQGIANSYVRGTMIRLGLRDHAFQTYNDAIYVNENTSISWHDALSSYGKAVDGFRKFIPKANGKNALNSMWHTWYAHRDDINQKTILRDAGYAASLGVKTIEIDAGWNLHEEYTIHREGYHDFDPVRFPNPKQMISEIHDMGLAVILHVSPLVMGHESKAYPEMKDYRITVKGEGYFLDPRYRRVHDYLLAAWKKLFLEYGVDGLWYDFLELPTAEADPPSDQHDLVSNNVNEAYNILMKSLYNLSLKLNPDAVIVLRRNTANLNSKLFCTHVWPMDVPQDYNMNRRDVLYMKTYGAGVLTHACCTSWSISESDENVACQMASITLAGVPAFSVKLEESPKSHNSIIRAWLRFYENNKEHLVLGKMKPLLPTPASAAILIEDENKTFIGFFEAVTGYVELSANFRELTLVNAFSEQTFTMLKGVNDGRYKMELYDQEWNFVSDKIVDSVKGSLVVDISAPSKCHIVVVKKI